jgi:hypothetical protein
MAESTREVGRNWNTNNITACIPCCSPNHRSRQAGKQAQYVPTNGITEKVAANTANKNINMKFTFQMEKRITTYGYLENSNKSMNS